MVRTEQWRRHLYHRAIIAQTNWMVYGRGSSERYGAIMARWEAWAAKQKWEPEAPKKKGRKRRFFYRINGRKKNAFVHTG